MTRKHRLGKFNLDQDYVRRWEELLPIMGNFVIVRAEFEYDTCKISYMAYSPLFDEVEEYCECPEYEINITLNDFGPAEITAKRIVPGVTNVYTRKEK
jgi:hypothetical protein